MEYKTYKTQSGIVCHDIFCDNFKTACITVELFVPLDKTYSSYLSLLSSVLKRGNAKFGQMDRIGAFLDQNYGASFGVSTSKTGDFHRLSLTTAFIDDRYTLDGEKVSQNMVSLIYSTLFEPLLQDGAFLPSFVEQEKRNLKDKIASLINDKRLYSLEKCRQTMFKDDIYGIYEQGDPDVIDTITPESLYNYFTDILKNSMIHICYAGGKLDTELLFKPLTNALDADDRPVYKTLVNNTVAEAVYKTEPMPVAQSKLNLGFRLGDAAKKDPFATRLFNVIYGSSATSKLFNNVRERLSLCYYCASTIDSLKNVMFVYSGIETCNYQKAHDEILYQLEQVKSGDITQEEFDNAKASLIDSYVQIGDSLASLIANRVVFSLSGIELSRDEQIEQVKAVTLERVIAAAQDIELDTVYLLKGTGGEQNAQ